MIRIGREIQCLQYAWFFTRGVLSSFNTFPGKQLDTTLCLLSPNKLSDIWSAANGGRASDLGPWILKHLGGCHAKAQFVKHQEQLVVNECLQTQQANFCIFFLFTQFCISYAGYLYFNIYVSHVVPIIPMSLFYHAWECMKYIGEYKILEAYFWFPFLET